MCGRSVGWTDGRTDGRTDVRTNNCYAHRDAKSPQDINIAGCDNL